MSLGPLSLRCSAVPVALVALVAALVGGLGLGAVAEVAHALPIGVRAKSRVELEHRRAATGIVLVGRLLDDASEPIADERITLELPGLEPATRLTDAAGGFEVPLTAREVTRLRRDGDLVTWTVQFDGNSRFGDTAESGSLDLSKRATRIQVVVAAPDSDSTATLVLGERPVEITVALNDVSERTDRPIQQAEVALEVGTGSQLVGATGRSGAATFVVRPASLAGGGRYRIKARFGGDAMHAPSRAETELLVLVPTRITLRVVREGDEQQGRYRMSGRVSDEQRPLDHQVVGIVALAPELEHGTPAAATTPAHPSAPRAFELVAATDADGVFVTALSAVDLQALRESLGAPRDRVRLDVRARFTPADELHAPAESASVVLEIPPPPGVPLRWYLLGLGLVVGFIAVAQALRSGALTRSLRSARDAVRRLLDRLKGKSFEPIERDPEPAFVTRYDAPDRVAPRTSDTISGVIIDAHTRAPLRGLVSARAGTRPSSDEPSPGPLTSRITALADGDGRFRMGPLSPGAWSVTVEAPGHLPREVALEVPHDGTYDGAQWALVAVHRSVRDIFAGALRGLGTPLAWGYATPREASRKALDLVDGRGPDRPTVEPPLAELTAIVEHTHFAQALGTAADVERARALRHTLEKRPSSDLPGDLR